MSEVIQFQSRNDQREAPLWTLEEYVNRGEVKVSLKAVSRWIKGFDPFDAAVTCATTKSREEAVTWWEKHLQEFADTLAELGVHGDRIEALRREYVEEVRSEIKVVRKLRMPVENWMYEQVGALVLQSRIRERMREGAGRA